MGKPTAGKPVVSLTEYIGQERPTRGTETSKYPQERKVTTTSSVAASEREPAQTEHMSRPQPLCVRGCGALSEGIADPSRSQQISV